MYRPLPEQLTIKNSPIEGLGLYAVEDIKKNSFIGLTHVRDEQFENKYISCLLYTSPSPRDPKTSRMPSSA